MIAMQTRSIGFCYDVSVPGTSYGQVSPGVHATLAPEWAPVARQPVSSIPLTQVERPTAGVTVQEPVATTGFEVTAFGDADVVVGCVWAIADEAVRTVATTRLRAMVGMDDLLR